MTKFYDGKKILTISMKDGRTGCDFEYDFFEVGGLKFDETVNAYKVDDVDYLVDYATDYANGTNSDADYDTDDNGDVVLPDLSINYNVEVM